MTQGAPGGAADRGATRDGLLALVLAALVAVLAVRPWPASTPTGVLVEVAGDVLRPGVHLAVPPTVAAAAASAGARVADDTPLAGGDRVVVHGDRATVEPAADPLLLARRVDVNAGTPVVMDTLPGIGPALAGRIEADRRRRGPFYEVSDLVRVRGIGPATLAGFASLVTVGDVGPRPPPARLDPNAASAGAWERVRGIGPVTAAAIVADREAHGPFPSCESLARVHGVGPATVARVRAVAACPEDSR